MILIRIALLIFPAACVFTLFVLYVKRISDGKWNGMELYKHATYGIPHMTGIALRMLDQASL
jgi:hypothetical protein